MGFLPKERIKQNLKKVDVFLEDTENEYIRVQDIPDTFVQGRSAFKLFGSEFLKVNVPLKIEILDKSGNTVWVDPVKYGQESSPKLPYRYVTVEVYPPPYNIPGEAEIVILAELDDEKVPFDIPQEFIGTYNVKYRKTINLDSSVTINTQPILFYKKPKIAATEIVKAQKKMDAPENTFISGSKLYGIVNAELSNQSYQSGSETNTQTNTSEGGKSSTSSGDIQKQANLWKYKTGEYASRNELEKRGIKKELGSPEVPQMVLYTNEANNFVSKMVGGDITVNNIDLPINEKRAISNGDPTLPDSAFQAAFTFPTFVATVEEVISDRQLIVNKPYSLEFDSTRFGGDDDKQRIYSNIGSISGQSPIYANFTASYVDWSVPSTSSYRFDSFIDLTIENMRTFSGDVYRLKVYGASDSSQGDFPVLLNTVVESPELLVDTNSPSGVLRSGYFIDQTHIDKYWNAYGGDNTTNTLTPYYTMSLADSVFLSGSYSTYNQVGRAELDNSYSFTVRKDVVYTLSFKARARKTEKTEISGNAYKKAKMFFHLSGSNLARDVDLQIQHSASFGHTLTNEFNQKVGLEILDDVSDDEWVDFGYISHTFTPKFKLNKIKNTDTVLQLRIHSGEWVIRDISLRAASDTGFSPDEMKVRIPIPPNTLRPDNWDFLIEYLDINGNTAETITFLDNIAISGSALVIEGSDNLLSGSLFMGNIQDSGIEMAGANSAFMRSVGYIGFQSASLSGKGGFMIWSGSVLPDAPDNYTGAGLEIHDGVTGDDESYFKFRTNPSLFDVKTSTFFFGKSNNPANFISGSNGNLQISSSNFSVGASGNVTMSGEVSASSGHIGNFRIINGKISGSNITLDATNSTIYKTDQGPGSDTSAPFDQLRDEYYIDFTPTVESPDNYYIKMGPNFMVDKDGILIASGATFEGSITASAGLIGGFTTDSHSFYSDNIFISGSPEVGGIDDPKYMFISTSNFNVKENGDITGSQVLFTGGKIAGATITDDKLSYGSNWAISASSTTNEYFISSSKFNVKQSGDITGSQVLFTGGKIAGATISNTELKYGSNWSISSSAQPNEYFISSSKFNVKQSGDITGSQVLFTGGKIAGFTVATTGITSTGVGVHPTGQTYAFTAGSSNQFNAKHSGQVTGSQVLFTGGKIAGFTISGNTLTATNFTLDASGKSISLGTGDAIFIADADEGIQLGAATFASAPFSVTTAGVLKAESGTIGGWNIDSSKIYSTNLYIRSSGVLETANFVSGVKGWRIDSANNGSAEFENVKIRGTLSTAVFEKETVNAVGGQLYIANSTAITGSGTVSASEATMSVENVGGFVANEIVSAKKIHNTGFATEYMLVESSSRDNPSSDTNFAGKLYVQRGYSGSLPGTNDTGSLGNAASIAQDFEPGQVLVSTGKVGTGYIRLNANPNDPYTPYIDIVERTGSAIYDVDLKARLGDLSGLSSARLHGTDPANAGFGLYSQNVFLEGGIVANTGSIAGVSMQDNTLFIGAGNYNNTDTEFYINGNTGTMSLKDKFVWDGSNLSINGSITLGAGSNASAGLPAGTVSGSAQLAADISGSQTALSSSAASDIAGAQSTADTGVSNAATAQSTADTAETNAQTGITNAASAQSTADTAITNAATAQSGIDAMETQVVLTNTGMAISSSGFSPNYGLAKFGTTTDFYDGTSSQNVKLRLQAAGVTAYGDDTNTYAYVYSGGVQLVEDGTQRALFAATSVIGSSTDKVTISDSGITIRENDADNISLSSGDITLTGGTITIQNTTNNNDKVVITQDSFKVYDNGTDVASFGAVTRIGDVANEHISMSNAGVHIKDGTIIRGQFTSTGTIIGDSSNAHISASTFNINIKKDASNYTQISSSGMSVFSGGSKVAGFATTVTLSDTTQIGPNITNLYDGGTDSGLAVDGDIFQVTVGTGIKKQIDLTDNGVYLGSGQSQLFDHTGVQFAQEDNVISNINAEQWIGSVKGDSNTSSDKEAWIVLHQDATLADNSARFKVGGNEPMYVYPSMVDMNASNTGVTHADGVARIYNSTISDSAKTILVLKHNDSTIGTNDDWVTFFTDTTEVGRIHSEVSYGTFTGYHPTPIPVNAKYSGSFGRISGSDTNWIESGSQYNNSDPILRPGMILASTGKIWTTGSIDGGISNSTPYTKVTTIQKDKAVFGIYAGTDTVDLYGLNIKTYISNGLGEGKMLVTDTNGNIEVGDFICSSNRYGHGEKQDNDIMHNYTVAKATETYNFTSASNDPDLGYKSVLIGVTYYCG